MSEQLHLIEESEYSTAPRELLARAALRMVGAPAMKYRSREMGVSMDEGFDCSGLVTYLLRSLGNDEPDIRHCGSYFDRFGVPVHEPGIGDIVFFSRHGDRPTHMGIMVHPRVFVHSPGKDNRTIEMARLVETPIDIIGPETIYNRNPIGFKRLAVQRGRWQYM